MVLNLLPADAVLILTVGDKRLRKLSAAFARMEIGEGDFEIAPSGERNAEPWLFWWMPDINYYQERRV